MRTARQTAILLAVILNRSGQSRARISAKTILHLARRERLRVAFLQSVMDELLEFDWVLAEVAGGFGAVRASALEAAKAVTGRRFLTPEERQRHLEWDALEREAMPESEDEKADEDE